MANSPLVTQAVETSSGNTLAEVQELLDELSNQNNTEISSLSAAGRAHFLKNLEAHGATYDGTTYVAGRNPASGRPPAVVGYSIMIPTDIGNLYVPATTTPTGL